MRNKKVRTHKKPRKTDKRKKKGKTLKKRRQCGGRNKVKPTEISKILSNIYILLSAPSIKFLPSSSIFHKNDKHWEIIYK